MELSDLQIGFMTLNNSWAPDFAPVHASHGISTIDLIQFADMAGAEIIRLPYSLAGVENDGFPQWQIDALATVFQAAKDAEMRIILQPGQTPSELAFDEDVTNAPKDVLAVLELADRFASGIAQIYRELPELSNVIAGIEIGNEPNMSNNYLQTPFVDLSPQHDRFYSVSVDNAQAYAEYVFALDSALKSAAPDLSVNLITGGIAHNDRPYMEAMFAKLQRLDVEISGFAIHPYTTNGIDDVGQPDRPESGRPTDPIGVPADKDSGWDHFYNYQAALQSILEIKSSYGFEKSDLWITEIGVPSYLGYRNAGPDGVLDQLRWFTEAFGVLDSLDEPSLKGVMVHHVLDNKSAEANAAFSAYDHDTDNDGSWREGEAAYGFFHEVDGSIEAKPVVDLMRAVTSKSDYSFLNVNSNYSVQAFDFNAVIPSSGMLDGVILLSHDQNDEILGSPFDDSLFAGSGNDNVRGQDGNDRIYGGSGDDVLQGGRGDDWLTGNNGRDRFEFTDAETGHDVIRDFVIGDDVIQLSAKTGFLHYPDVKSALKGDGNSATLSLSVENSIKLIGIQPNDLQATDFVFF